MIETQPITNSEQIKELLEWTKSKSHRDYFLIYCALYTGLRITDLLQIKHHDIESGEYYLNEGKTGKVSRVLINPKIQKLFKKLKFEKGYVFASARNSKDDRGYIGRKTAHKIISKRGQEIGIKGLAPHSLRKTFGYFHYKKNKDIFSLMKTFNHSSPTITERYIGLTTDIANKTRSEIDFGI